MNYWGHNSNFSDWQLRVPFILYQEGSLAQKVHHLTTHHDVLPTLMQEFLSCTNAASDYSVGVNLMALPEHERPWFVAASYSDYALIGGDAVVTMNELRRHEVRDRDTYETLDHHLPVWVKQAMQQLSLFYADKE